jgi:hypothetical protein
MTLNSPYGTMILKEKTVTVSLKDLSMLKLEEFNMILIASN